jgi:UDP-2,3-diacylglucosamine pyrophosphatase LpxH
MSKRTSRDACTSSSHLGSSSFGENLNISRSRTRTRYGVSIPNFRRESHSLSELQLRLEFSARLSRADSVPITSYRSIWMSDFHLGTLRCQALPLLDFLRSHQAQNLYLVGDIIDGWNIGRSWNFDDTQKAVADEIGSWRKRGSCVEFLPGNHDQFSLDLVESLLGLAPRRTELIHHTADGRRMLVAHGHQFDRAVSSGRWVKRGQLYAMALRIHQWYAGEWTRRCVQRRSASAYLRHRVKKIIEYLTDIDDRAVFEAVRRARADGLICGHVHRAEQRLIGSIWYMNDGDWVESCTALVEDHTGALHLVRWPWSLANSAEIASRTNQEQACAR